MVAPQFDVPARSADLSRDVMDVPELQRGLGILEAQMHDGRLQNAEGKVGTGRGVFSYVDLLGVLLLAQLCGQGGVPEESGAVGLSGTRGRALLQRSSSRRLRRSPRP